MPLAVHVVVTGFDTPCAWVDRPRVDATRLPSCPVAKASRAVTADGVQIALYEFGLGAGGGAVLPTMVMAHATGFCSGVLGPLAQHLTGSYRCLAFDERGHGASGVAPEGPVGWRRWDWHGFGLDVLAVVDRLSGGVGANGGIGADGGIGAEGGLGDIYGFGHSCGAAALLMAEIARPGTFSGLYCFEPVVFRPPPPGTLAHSSPLAEATLHRREVFGSRAEAYAFFATKAPFSGFDPAVLSAYVDCGLEDTADGDARLRCRREHEALIYTAGVAHDAWDHLGGVACPVVVAFGESSRFMGPGDAAALAARLPRAQVEAVAGVGHLGPMERPGPLASSVLRTLAG